MPGAATSGASEPIEGERLLDRYKILGRAGSGGMACIFRAFDERLGRTVCVKLLREPIAPDDGSTGSETYEATYSHFLQEARALSTLQHPNTLRIYDFGYIGNARPFQVSEFLDGGNLDERVRRTGPLHPAEALTILDPIAGAVAEAHYRGILHRDIKPSNILFARAGDTLVPKLADFGISQTTFRRRMESHHPEADDSEWISSFSTVTLFSPRWAAPEQLAGTWEGPATDVYALALVACFMLLGRALFDDRDPRATFVDRLNGEDLTAGRLAERGVSGALARVLLSALRTDPRSRTDDPLGFCAELRHALGITPVPASSSRPRQVAAPEVTHEDTIEEVSREHQAGGRRVRFVDADEGLELAFPDARGEVTRMRLTALPSSRALLIKGLTCFVAKPGGRPTPALTVATDGRAELVSSSRAVIDTISWSFGSPTPEGQVFQVDGEPLFVPRERGARAVAVSVASQRDVVILCVRA
jgi:serine/threonine-protein kinase